MKPNASQKQALKKNNSHSTSLLKEIQEKLNPQSESPYLDALGLLSHISELDRSQILAHPELELTTRQNKALESAMKELLSGIPLPYVLGEWEFFQLKFQVTPDVLIPRPETEGLVELALEWLNNHPGSRSCLEIGTGCGCIAVSLAKSVPDLQITATDISDKALEIARENALRHGVLDQIQFLERDLLSGITGKTDLLVANLPYIPTEKLKNLSVFHTEPLQALDGGQDGLLHIKKVLQSARKNIRPGGAIFLELDEDTGAAALGLAHDVWPGLTILLKQDLSGQDRYLSIQCP